MIEFTSTSPFVTQVINQLQRGKLSSGSKLQIGTSKPNSLLDLFSLGRLLSFINLLQSPPHSINVEFIFPAFLRNLKLRKHIENLRNLGFFEYCDTHNIQYTFDTKSQLYLPHIVNEKEVGQDRTIEGKAYWRCLLPIQLYSFEQPAPGNERQVIKIVNGFVKEFSNQINVAMSGMRISYKDIGLELSHILFSVIRELLSNTITHSRKSEFLFAMTVSRETWAGYRPHRPGITFLSGQDKYEILVMDFGQGISPSVMNILNDGRDVNTEADYFKLAKWTEALQMDRAKEESLLTNIFRGDLVIRKGRKSEGLYELGQSLSWFGGLLSLFTGRSELQISSAENEELSPELRRLKDPNLKNPYYLPGVIASPVLPSHQIKTILIKRLADNLTKEVERQISENGASKSCTIRRLSHMPSGFFGGMSTIKIRRRSELDAELIATAYQKERERENSKLSGDAAGSGGGEQSGGFRPFFWDIDLKMSDNIDLGFLDSLIQELCKRLDLFETTNSRNFFKLVFTNVPRNIIQALRKRNCQSFLMLKETFCLMLDEADEPHFLGAPRASNNIFDVEDALALIFHAGSVPKEKLISRSDLGLSNHAIDQVQRLLGTNEDSIFFCQDTNEKLTFECYDIMGALREARRQSFTALKDFRIYEVDGDSLKAAFKLRNGTYVDSIYDFCLFWSEENKLVDCTKLLLAQSGFPIVDTIVAFMNNGDRLAAAIQRYTKAPNLIIVDPHRPDSWMNQEIDGDFILVLDAIYPGDDKGGYVKDFIDQLHEINSDANIQQILTLCDFRQETASTLSSQRLVQDASDSLLVGKQVVSVPLPEELLIPRSITPKAAINIVQNFQTYILSKPTQSSDEPVRGDGADLSWKSHQYSPIELSTEFWQNVSALGVIDSKRTGREDRNVLFYENNERLIQNSRMRRIVTEFVADYVKNILDLKIDVILHPTHPVGSFLAQLVSKQLNNTPLVLPLTQRKYGGQIELTSDDYDFYKKRIEKIKNVRGHSKLMSLIVDDSVLSGNSLFTMLGVAARLGLSTNGVLVLLSRLSPEVSSTLSLLSVNFAYLYRLHMPILTSNQSPDTKLRELNEKVLRSSNSYFGQLWGNVLKDELDDEKDGGSHFQPSSEEINQNLPPRVTPAFLNNIRAEHTDTHVLRQVIQNLLLHPDPYILTFYTRVGIAYNFLEQLVHESNFWHLLMGLFESAESPKAKSQSILLVRKILYILAFSKHIFPFTVYQKFQETCCEFIRRCFDDGSWVELKDFVTDCVMWLGVTGSEKITEAGKNILLSTLSYSFGNFSMPKASEGLPYEGAQRDVTPEQRKAAMDIVGAFAWSLHVYFSQKGMNILDNNSASDLVDTIIKRHPSIEGNLVLIDLLEPVMAVSNHLREKIGIETWEPEEEFIRVLSSTSSEPNLINYLKDAPGYTCTLKTVLRICKADTVLLYVKNRSDKEYFLRVFDTRQNKRADDDLKSEHLRQSYLHEDIKERMDESLFFSSSRRDHTTAINYFSKNSKHLWCMGGPVNIRGSQMSYYVILGYWQRGPKPALQSTAYYYWLKCEALLRDILPQIHSKYVESATEWNAHIQSIKPFHPIASNDARRTEIVNARREVVSLAMTKIDIGDLLRRAVRMSSEPVYKLEAIRDQIVQVCKNLRVFVKSILDNVRNTELTQKSLLNRRNLPIHGPLMEALTTRQQSTFCALHIAVLEFIAYESLFNAIAYHDKDITVKIKFNDEPSMFHHISSPVDLLGITLTIMNDIHPKAVSDSVPVKPIGRIACETAASAVNGSFSSGYNEDNTRWVATLMLPAYRVPDDLRRQLHELLG